jgi:hypothetical protein
MPNKMHPQGDTMMRRRTFLTTTAILLCAPSLISDVQAQAPNPDARGKLTIWLGYPG